MISFSTKFPILQDKQWLCEKYLKEKLTPDEIATLIGAKSFQPVRKALLAHDIPMRSYREAQASKRASDFFNLDTEVLIGCLLGDGSLGIFNRKSRECAPYFYKKNKFREHILYVGSFLFSENVESRISEVKEKCRGKNLIYYHLASLTQDELRPWYRAWYPEEKNYIKSVPKDIRLTSRTLLHWFLDDGCSLYSRKTDTKWYPRVVLSCQSFSVTEQEFLVSRLLADLAISSYIEKTNSGTGYRIAIPQQDTPLFFEKIGDCPLDCFQYKWKDILKVG